MLTSFAKEYFGSCLWILLASCAALALSACEFEAPEPGKNYYRPNPYAPLTDEDRALAVEHAGIGRLVAAAEKMREWHAENGTGLSLNPPLSDAELEAAAAAFGCELPEELMALWRWRNGESTEVFTWYHRFLSVEESLAEYRSLNREPFYIWQENWIPVFEYPEEWYFVECADDARSASPLSHYFIETGSFFAYTNLTTYLETMAAAMERGVLEWQDGEWHEDDAGLAVTHREHNPSGTYPYGVE